MAACEIHLRLAPMLFWIWIKYRENKLKLYTRRVRIFPTCINCVFGEISAFSWILYGCVSSFWHMFVIVWIVFFCINLFHFGKFLDRKWKIVLYKIIEFITKTINSNGGMCIEIVQCTIFEIESSNANKILKITIYSIRNKRHMYIIHRINVPSSSQCTWHNTAVDNKWAEMRLIETDIEIETLSFWHLLLYNRTLVLIFQRVGASVIHRLKNKYLFLYTTI